MLIDWERSGRTGKYLALGQEVRTSLRSVRTPWPRAKYFPVRPSHSVNEYIVLSRGHLPNAWTQQFMNWSARNKSCNLIYPVFFLFRETGFTSNYTVEMSWLQNAWTSNLSITTPWKLSQRLSNTYKHCSIAFETSRFRVSCTCFRQQLKYLRVLRRLERVFRCTRARNLHQDAHVSWMNQNKLTGS